MEYYEEDVELGQGPGKEKFYKWAKDDITILLKYYEDFVRNSVFSKRKLLWITLAKELQEYGIPVDAVQCENKWKALCRAYRNQYKSFQYRETIERILSLNNTENSIFGNEKDFSHGIKRQKIEHDSEKGEIEERNQSKSWRADEVETLLNVWEANILTLSSMSKKSVYEKVAETLRLNGISVNAVNVEHKWKGLLRALRRHNTSQHHKKTSIDLRVEKLYKLGLEAETETENIDEDITQEASTNEGNTYHTLTTSKSGTTTGILTLLRSASENVEAFPLEQDYHQQEYLEDSLPMEDSCHNIEQVRSNTEILDENMTFEERLLRFLKEQEEAKQRRHEEKMELKRKKIGLLEALVQSKNKD